MYSQYENLNILVNVGKPNCRRTMEGFLVFKWTHKSPSTPESINIADLADFMFENTLTFFYKNLFSKSIEAAGNLLMLQQLTIKLAGGGGRFVEPPSFVFFGLKFLPLDQLPNAFAQLFLDNEYIF